MSGAEIAQQFRHRHVALADVDGLEPAVDLPEDLAAAHSVGLRHRLAEGEELEAAAPGLVRRGDAEIGGDLHPGIALGPVDEHRAGVIGGTERGIGEGASADTLARLQDDRLASGRLQLARCGDSGDAGTDDDDVEIGRIGAPAPADNVRGERASAHEEGPAVEHC